jgi:hypothetical protein
MIPGAMPARKSFEIERPAATPKMMKPIDGGMIGPMMPPAAMRPGGARPVVASLHHHRIEQRSERGSIRGSGARERGENARRHDHDVAEPALDVAHQRQRHVDDALRQAAGVHDLAGEHEERHRHEREAVGAVDEVLRDDLRIHHVEVIHQGDAADEQRERDRHADRHGTQQREQEDGNGHGDLPWSVLFRGWSRGHGARTTAVGIELVLQLLELAPSPRSP